MPGTHLSGRSKPPSTVGTKDPSILVSDCNHPPVLWYPSEDSGQSNYSLVAASPSPDFLF